MARRRLMTDEQWAAFLGAPTDERMLVRHYTLSRDDLDIVAAKRTAANRLGCAVVLAYLHHPGRAPEPGEAPPSAVLAYLARQVGAKPADFTAFARRDQNRREQIAAIMARTGHRSFSRATLREMAGWLTARAQVTREPHALAVALVEELRRRRVLLPSAGVLDLVVHRARARAERLVQEIIADGLDDDGTLSVLLEPWADTGTAMLVWLRHPPLSPAARNIVGLCERLATLRDLGVPGAARERVPEAAFDRLAAEGLRTTVQHLRDLREPRRSATLAAVAVRLEAELTDAALSMFVKLMGNLGRRAERRAADKALKSVREVRGHLRTLVAACRAVIEARNAGADPFQALERDVGWCRLTRCVAEAADLADPRTVDGRGELLARYATVRAFAPALLATFAFRGGPPAAALLRALDVLREMYAKGRRALPARVPTGFIRRSWRPFVQLDGALDRKAYEICVLSELRDRLRAGDVWVEGARQYRDFESCLVPRETFAALDAGAALPVAVGRDGAAHLAALRPGLDATMEEVARLAASGRLVDVDLSGGALRIAPIRDATPPEAETLNRAAYDLLPRVKITDLLLEVDRWTGFAACFTHARSGLPADNAGAVLTAVLADGINLGLTRMAEACRGFTMRQLAWAHDWHIREETYAAALVRLIDAHRALPLAAVWGDGRTSSSDGQFYRAGGRAAATGDINARHGNEPGVAFYTHVSDQYGPFHTKVIAATASEAPHVLDGLLYHRTGLEIGEHFTDTGGATDHVFGLCALLGFRFAPRLRDLKDRRIHLLPGQPVPEPLRPVFGGTIDADHLVAHWDELLRLATSVRSGTVTASALLRRLAAYPRQNGLAVALRELGRIERAQFTLDWLRDPALRRRASAGLNKGEARNALARAVFFNRLGELRDRRFENQVFRASGLNLLVSAIILWNTRYLEVALAELAGRGVVTPPELVRHVAPLGWEHIGLTGDYVWGADQLPREGLRQLRTPPSLLAA